MERKKITFDSFIRGSIGCVLVVGILMLVERLSGVLLPFFIAWLIAYMVYPLVKFFQYKLRLKSRIVSIFCALFLITLVGVSLFYLLVPPMVSEIGRMNDLLVTYLTNGAGNNVPKNLSEFIHENIDLQALNRILREYSCSHQRYGAQSVGPACGVAQYPVQHSRLLYHIIICNLYIAGL